MTLTVRLLAVAAGLLVIGGGAAVWWHDRPAAVIARILAIPQPPGSLRAAKCEDWSFTDANVTCVFEVAPSDFPFLLRGRSFEAKAADGKSHDLSGGPRLGENFRVAERFEALPPKLMDGGGVWLLADAAHRRVQLDLYRE